MQNPAYDEEITAAVRFLAGIIPNPVMFLTEVRTLSLHAAQWDAAGDSLDKKLAAGQSMRQTVAALQRQIHES